MVTVTMTTGRERYDCPESLFNPAMLGSESEGIHHMIYDSVNKCDIDLRRDFYNNIVLSGICLLETVMWHVAKNTMTRQQTNDN